MCFVHIILINFLSSNVGLMTLHLTLVYICSILQKIFGIPIQQFYNNMERKWLDHLLGVNDTSFLRKITWTKELIKKQK